MSRYKQRKPVWFYSKVKSYFVMFMSDPVAFENNLLADRCFASAIE